MRISLTAPWVLALLVLAAYLVLVCVWLSQHDWDASTFIVAGDKFVDEARTPAPIAVLPNSAGYDGEFYYRLALNPFNTETTAYGIRFDGTAYRFQRIGYPLLAWAVSLGDARLLPWVMIGLNLAGLGLIAWVGTGIALRAGAPAWAGTLTALYPGFFLTLLRDTTEIVAAAFAVMALSFALRRSFWKAGLLAAAAVLPRETTVLYLAGFGVVTLLRMLKARRWSWDIAPMAIPVAAYCGWKYALFLKFGVLPDDVSLHDLGAPFAGLLQYLDTNLFGHVRYVPIPGLDRRIHEYFVGAALFCGVAMAIAGARMFRKPMPPALAIPWVGYAVLVVLLSVSVWAQPYDFLRVFTDCYLVGVVALILSRHRLSLHASAGMVGLMWWPTIWYGLLMP